MGMLKKRPFRFGKQGSHCVFVRLNHFSYRKLVHIIFVKLDDLVVGIESLFGREKFNLPQVFPSRSRFQNFDVIYLLRFRLQGADVAAEDKMPPFTVLASFSVRFPPCGPGR